MTRGRTLDVGYVWRAAALGLGWFVVLLVPRITREFLLGDAWQNLACLALASVVVALACRGYIARADSFGADLVRAIALPYAGSLIFLSLTAVLLWTRSLIHGGLMNVHDTASLYLMGLVATTVSLFVVVPYGLLCQRVMRAAADRSA